MVSLPFGVWHGILSRSVAAVGTSTVNLTMVGFSEEDDESTSTGRDISAGESRPRRNTTSIHAAITHPGSVRINVQGAFIVDEESDLQSGSGGRHHDTKDIRLPNHTAVVSHVAVDVSLDIYTL